jgi:hypothetical protein
MCGSCCLIRDGASDIALRRQRGGIETCSIYGANTTFYLADIVPSLTIALGSARTLGLESEQIGPSGGCGNCYNPATRGRHHSPRRLFAVLWKQPVLSSLMRTVADQESACAKRWAIAYPVEQHFGRKAYSIALAANIAPLIADPGPEKHDG